MIEKTERPPPGGLLFLNYEAQRDAAKQASDEREAVAAKTG
jgi:hypothetical protein